MVSQLSCLVNTLDSTGFAICKQPAFFEVCVWAYLPSLDSGEWVTDLVIFLLFYEGLDTIRTTERYVFTPFMCAHFTSSDGGWLWMMTVPPGWELHPFKHLETLKLLSGCNSYDFSMRWGHQEYQRHYDCSTETGPEPYSNFRLFHSVRVTGCDHVDLAVMESNHSGSNNHK